MRRRSRINPSLRVLESRVLLTFTATCLGQDNAAVDVVTSGTAVGSDGHQDIHIKLGDLTDQIKSLEVAGPNGMKWAFGPRTSTNLSAAAADITSPNNAGNTDLYISRSISVGGITTSLSNGNALSITIIYARGVSAGGVSAGEVSETYQSLAVSGLAPGGDATQLPTLPNVLHNITTTWTAGSVDQNPQLKIDGLLTSRSVRAATLSDSAGTTWVYTGTTSTGYYTESDYDLLTSAYPTQGYYDLGFSRNPADLSKADLSFQAFANEANKQMTLRVVYDDSTTPGSMEIVQFAGTATNPALRPASAGSKPIDTSGTPTTVSPGTRTNSAAVNYIHTATADYNVQAFLDDSNNKYIKFSVGTYYLDTPVAFKHSVSVIADNPNGPTNPSTTWLFQSTASATWALASGALNINSDNVSLDGFAVRFASTVRAGEVGNTSNSWNFSSTGTAVIQAAGSVKAGIQIKNMYIESPRGPATAKHLGALDESIRAINTDGFDSGIVTGNVVKGGTVFLGHGPWAVSNNDHRGPMINTYASDAFAFASNYETGSHDIVFTNNHVHPVSSTLVGGEVDASGAVFRLVNFHGRTMSSLIEMNSFDGGAGQNDGQKIWKDSEGVANPNMAEIIMAENDTLHYEGAVLNAADSGRIIQIGTLRGPAGESGDVVAILTGSRAGEYYRIAQAIDSRTYILERPLPSPFDYDIAIARGLVDTTIRGNTIDLSTVDQGDVAISLSGNVFGAMIVGNMFKYGHSLALYSHSTKESPTGLPAGAVPAGVYGESHAIQFATFGAPGQGNYVIDTTNFNHTFGVVNFPAPTNPDFRVYSHRTYFKWTFDSNVFGWDVAPQNTAANASPVVLSFGDTPAAQLFDGAQAVLTFVNNTGYVPSGYAQPVLHVSDGVVNSSTATIYDIVLPKDLLRVIAIDSGSSGAVGGFSADSYVTGGMTNGPVTQSIDLSGVLSPAPMAIYQTERWSSTSFTYTVPSLTPSGRYVVRLHFSENTYSSVGDRKFNVAINGTTVLSNFDPYAAAGGKYRAVVERFTATADASGSIAIQFDNVKGNATVMGIEVISAGGAVSASASGDGSFVGNTGYFTSTATLIPYTDGNAVVTTGVTAPAPQSVYRNELYVANAGESFTLTMPGLTPGASYAVRLHFAEATFNAAGLRKFNVAINGTTVLSNFDPYAAAGGKYRAVVEQFTAAADAAGKVAVVFTNVAGGAFVNGVEVIPSAQATAFVAGANFSVKSTKLGTAAGLTSKSRADSTAGPAGRASADGAVQPSPGFVHLLGGSFTDLFLPATHPGATLPPRMVGYKTPDRTQFESTPIPYGEAAIPNAGSWFPVRLRRPSRAFQHTKADRIG